MHVAATVVDTYVPTGWLAAVVPGVSAYKTLPVALGALAVDCLLAVMLTSLLRDRISASAWRAVHWLSYLCWPIAVLHVVLIGTDMRFRWMDALVLGLRRHRGGRGAAPRSPGASGAVPEGARTVLHPHPRGAAATRTRTRAGPHPGTRATRRAPRRVDAALAVTVVAPAGTARLFADLDGRAARRPRRAPSRSTARRDVAATCSTSSTRRG